jgi:hypothetical protein
MKRPYTPFKEVLAGSYQNLMPLSEIGIRNEQLRVRRMMDDASRYNKPIDPRTEEYGRMIGAVFNMSSGGAVPASWWWQTPRYQFPMMR